MKVFGSKHLLLIVLSTLFLTSQSFAQRYWNVAAQFDGSDSSYVAVVPYTGLDNLTGNFTIECWLKADSNMTGTVFGKRNVRFNDSRDW